MEAYHILLIAAVLAAIAFWIWHMFFRRRRITKASALQFFPLTAEELHVD